MHWDIQSTICAVATGNVSAARGAIRISGPDTVPLLAAIVPESAIQSAKRATRIVISFPLGDPFGELEMDLWLWPDGRSYTGAPSAELHMIGNQVLLNRVIQVLVQHGAKVAEPGEFTLRAFLSGRMDLTQCEAVLGAINARSDRQFEVALRQLAGGLSQPLRSVRTTLIELLADIEAGLDFVDEDIEFVSKADIVNRIEESELAIGSMIRQMALRQGNESRSDIVLTGKPNAGKSSLVNAMTGSNTAIVNQKAGTTRDYLRVPLQRDGKTIYVIDTAGMDLSSNAFINRPLEGCGDMDSKMEGLAEQMTIQQRESASLVLYCIDSTLEDSSVGNEIASFRSLYTTHEHTWLVWTKSEEGFEHTQIDRSLDAYRVFQTSAKSGRGVNKLVEELFHWYQEEAAEVAMVVASTASRCLSSLEDAMGALRNSYHAAEESANELVAGELRIALEAIGKVAGEVYNDDILDALFSRFCIGK